MDFEQLKEIMSSEQILSRSLYALARAREDAARLSDMRDEAEQDMWATIEAKEYLAIDKELAQVRGAIAELRDVISDHAVGLFDGEDRDVAPGVKIAVYKTFKLDDAAAREWAVDNKHYLLLDPNSSRFKAMRDALPNELYWIEETPRPRISSNLSEDYPADTHSEEE